MHWKSHFEINTVLQIVHPGECFTSERVLWVDERDEIVVLIDIFLKSAREYRMPIRDLLTALQDGNAQRIPDPFSYLWLPDDQYSQARITDRDNRIALITPFLDADKQAQYDSVKRRAIMRTVCSLRVHGSSGSKSFRYQLIRQYLQRGQIHNALLSDRANGGYTKERRLLSPPKIKEGRSRNAVTYEQRRAGFIFSEAQRVAILPTIIAERGRIQRNGRCQTWRDIAQKVWEIYFPDHMEFISGKQVVVPKLASQCPTIRQIKHLYLQHDDMAGMLRRRSGEKQFNLRMREKLGDQRDVASGPMQVVQIDFTIADIFLVDSRRVRVMGRPTIAMIRDTFSRVIVGFAVAWRRESWHTATLAILNMVGDKVEFCGELGIEITPDMWPSGLFETALSDNGALIAHLFEYFRKSLRLNFDNTASGRGDRKPVVESGFKDLNDNLIYRLDGAIHHAYDRRQAKENIQRAKKSARLTLRDLMKAIAEYCIHYNNFRLIDSYPLSDDMVGNVAAIPIQLWNFGIVHRAGVPRELSIDQARLHCLCRGRASIRSSGIHFEGKPYSCERAMREGWFVKARNVGRWDIDVLYHPSNLEIIYLLPLGAGKAGGTVALEPCYRVRIEGDTTNISIRELHALRREKATHREQHLQTAGQSEARYQAKINSIGPQAFSPEPVLSSKVNMKDLQRMEITKDAVRVHDGLCSGTPQGLQSDILAPPLSQEEYPQGDFEILRDLV